MTRYICAAAYLSRPVAGRATPVLGRGWASDRVEGPAVALMDKGAVVRSCAAKSLGAIGDPRAAEPLVTALADKEGGVHDSAAKALARIGKPSVEALLVALRSTSSSVRTAAAQVLGGIADVRSEECGVAKCHPPFFSTPPSTHIRGEDRPEPAER